MVLLLKFLLYNFSYHNKHKNSTVLLFLFTIESHIIISRLKDLQS